MFRMAIALCLLLLGGCVRGPPAPTNWHRTDGHVVSPQQLQMDTTICKGELEKVAVLGLAKSTVDSRLGMDQQDRRVYVGCMAEKGYLAE